MQDDDLFKDTVYVKKKEHTPYEKLRKLRGWSQEKAAEVFATNRRAIIDIEAGRRDPPKQIVRMMDKEYGCNGQLIGYWLTKFSWGEPEPTIFEKIRRWIYGGANKNR